MTVSTRSRTAARKAADAVCVSPAAVELAHAAAVELEGPDAVGEHLGHDVEAERLVTHYFACTMKAYGGWRWAVTVARAARAKSATVAEAVLLPGSDALLAPEWVPWAERLKPGDLGPGDILPTREDDPRLVPGFTAVDEDVAGGAVAIELGSAAATDTSSAGDGADDTDAADSADGVGVDPVAGSVAQILQLGPIGWELGIGRPRVLSRHGRDEATDRWHAGDAGPEAPVARAAPASCGTCGFLVPLGGALSQAFGACANEYSPSDGRVVAFDHGCGAHSEAAVAADRHELPAPILDEVAFDLMEVTATDQNEGSVSPDAPAEDLGHS